MFDDMYGHFGFDEGPTLKMGMTLTERNKIMKTRTLILSGAALIAFCVPPVFAQSQSTTTPSTSSTPTTSMATTPATPKPGEVADRKDNQQDRVANGVQSGQLTAGETKNLETKEAGLNKEDRTMRSEDDGHLTAADRTKLNNQQNHLSNKIYQDKHNANTAHYGNNQVGQRRENQQDRIAQGIKSGQLTAGETAKAENQQQGINREDAGMRQANGGKLSKTDKRALNQQQNKASRNIYNKKHNAAHTRP
ncbi:MAG: hypothetical protein ACRD5R_03810 [Candidatus Acidiferrales bacterium]